MVDTLKTGMPHGDGARAAARDAVGGAIRNRVLTAEDRLRRLESTAWRTLLLGGGYLLLYVGLYLARPFGERGAVVLSDFGEVPMAALAVFLGLRVVHADSRTSGRLAWGLIAVAIAADLIANVVYGAFDLAGQQPFPSIADAFYLLFYPLMFAGLLRLPTPNGRRELADWRIWSNVAIGLLGGGMAVLHFVLLPAITQLDTDPFAATISLAYPVGDLALVAALATLLSRRPFASDRPAIGWFVGGVGVWLVADILFALQTAAGSYAAGSPADFLWLLGDAGFVVAAECELLGLRDPRPKLGASDLRVARLGSYAMLALGLATLIVSAFTLDGDITLLAVGSAILTALVVARQLADEQTRRRLEAARLAEHEAAAAIATRLARTDLLTGLPNRLQFDEVLREAIATSRSSGRPLTLVYADLDLFKAVNDSLGHAAGDDLLREVAERLSSGTRSSDTVARLGGDEFAVILPDTTLETAVGIAARLKAIVERPCELGTTPLALTASFGLSCVSDLAADADALMHQADAAMYRAKREHRPPTAWTPTLERPVPAIGLIRELRAAIENHELVLRFQPISTLRPRRIVGCEALVRWPHPTLGLLTPDRFLPLASQAGLMPRLDAEVLGMACATLAGWRAAGLELEMSVNISTASIATSWLAASVVDLLAAYRLPPSSLTLELTEEALFDVEASLAAVRAVREAGVGIALDDFGAGSSSLARLRDLEADSLKIDRAFIAAARSGSRERTIVEAIVNLAHGLGLSVVAEGIEDRAMLTFLAAIGADAGQGYVIAHPLEASELERLVRRSKGVRSRLGSARRLAVGGAA